MPGLNHIGPLSSPASSVQDSTGNHTLDSVLEQYSKLFQNDLGCYTGTPVVLNESKEAEFYKARPVPYALQSKVESTLLKMEKDGVIERLTSAVSAAPIVVVGKKESHEVRVCGHFNVTYSAFVNVDTYPMPQIEDGGHGFSLEGMHRFQCPGYETSLSQDTSCKGITAISHCQYSHWITCISVVAKWCTFRSSHFSEN